MYSIFEGSPLKEGFHGTHMEPPLDLPLNTTLDCHVFY